MNERSKQTPSKQSLFSFSASGADGMMCWKLFEVSCGFMLEWWECTGDLEVSCSNSNSEVA